MHKDVFPFSGANEISKVLWDKSIPKIFVILSSKGKEKKLEGCPKVKTSARKNN